MKWNYDNGKKGGCSAINEIEVPEINAKKMGEWVSSPDYVGVKV